MCTLVFFLEKGQAVTLKACTGCGQCCRVWTCSLSRILHGTTTNCPSLVLRRGKWRCQEVLRNGAHLRNFLRIGEGCGATDVPPWPESKR